MFPNLISELHTLFKETFSRGAATIIIPDWAEHGAGDIAKMLKQIGIAVWDLTYGEDFFSFRVKKKQEAHAENYLAKRGIPVGLPEKPTTEEILKTNTNYAVEVMKDRLMKGGTYYGDRQETVRRRRQKNH